MSATSVDSSISSLSAAREIVGLAALELETKTTSKATASSILVSKKYGRPVNSTMPQ
ncbi:hypothetical protein [Candidatus Nitrososphaera evergladensis]|uniref:hypothetical protein n=1 Tax=Candidatus Nitrososphaera evergladensis TaxID=1459637 RepID=UPI00130E1C80|nr:hypothetical protein [Candidatus Nitrososphaera evergladensis]